MKTLVYKIHKNDENGNSELLKKGTESEVRRAWNEIEKVKGFDHGLSVGWELNGKSLGTILLESK